MSFDDTDPDHMPWGKYRGKPLGWLPPSYIGWVLSESSADEELKERLRTEIRYRVENEGYEMPFGKYKGTLIGRLDEPYLQPLLHWLREQERRIEPITTAVEIELSNRGAPV